MGGATTDRTRRGGRRLSVLAAGSALAATLLLAVVGTVSAAGHDVTISGFAFAPSSLHVAVGDTVTWTNQDGVNHTATGTGFDTGPIANGATASVTFDKAGTFAYHCAIHPSMTGTIVVGAAAVATPKPTARTAGASLPATDTNDPAVDAAAGSTQYGWIVLLASAGAVLATLLRPARGRRRGRLG